MKGEIPRTEAGDSRVDLLDAIRSKVDRGERLNRAERAVLHADSIDCVFEKIHPLIEGGRTGRALQIVLGEIAVNSIAHAEKRDATEDRIARLEAQHTVAISEIKNDIKGIRKHLVSRMLAKPKTAGKVSASHVSKRMPTQRRGRA